MERPANREVLERLNRLWRVAGAPPAGAGLPGTLVYRLRLMLARLLAPQETFNAAVVEYVNATANALEQARIATDEAIRYRESLAARERRIETAMTSILTAHDELRTSLGVVQQATQSIKREVARLSESGVAVTTVGAVPPSPDSLDSYKYVGFEDQFRGSADDIRQRVAEYLPVFVDASDVLDVGCGRGEFLALLREHGVSARGIDLNHAMVEVCREKGLQAAQGDALVYLQSMPPESLGGLFAAQVVEHLEPAYLARFLDAAFAALRPAAPIVLETINPACWFAFFESYIRDITHVRPIHPDTLKYLLIASGFQRIEIRYRAPYPEAEKLRPLAQHAALGDAVDTLNANVEKINRLLFTYLDYAAIGRRP